MKWREFVFGSLLIYLAVYPLRVFGLGNPQPADCVALAGLMASGIAGWKWRNELGRRILEGIGLIRPLIVAILWAVMVNAVYFLIHGNFTFVKSSLYLIYNSLLLIWIGSLAHWHIERLKDVFQIGLVVSSVLCFGLVFFIYFFGMPDSVRSWYPGARFYPWRITGWFLNPNQLAAWVLSILVIYSLLPTAPLGIRSWTRWGNGFLLVGAGASLALSSSTAGLAGGLAWAMATMIARPGLWMSVLLAAVVYLAFLLEPFTAGEINQARLNELGEGEDAGGYLLEKVMTSSDPWSVRSYDRLWNYPQYLMFGAGDGAYRRFPYTPNPDLKREIHSTVAAYLFSYGIVGTGLLLWFVWKAIGVMGWRKMLIVLGTSLAYGLGHNGIRMSLIWMAMGLAIGMGLHEDQTGRRRFRPSV